MIEVILDKGTKIKVQFPESLVYGSLRPIKRGGKTAYFCRECFKKTKSIRDSVIPLKTPHWTQSVYLDGIQESRQPTRICCEHAKEWLASKIPQELLDSLKESAEDAAEKILSTKNRVKLDSESLEELYELAVVFNP